MAEATYARDQLLDRRAKLTSVLSRTPVNPHLTALLDEVDAALERIQDGSFGICEYCHDTIEADRLACDPLIRFCIDHLSREERSALEQDLVLAANMQSGLLPPREQRFGDWEIAHHYQPKGAVSGDYCDVITCPGGELFLLVGDASGKGVAASLLMTQLHAIFRSLIHCQISLKELMERANRILCEGNAGRAYATLVCARISPSGCLEISNAGHCPPLVARKSDVTRIEPASLPLGMFSEVEYGVECYQLDPGDTLILYTDGVTETTNQDDDYGEERVEQLLRRCLNLDPRALVDACMDDVAAFRGASPASDDITLMAVRRSTGIPAGVGFSG
jgi:sigma-B regulation protein RsbU (phosphoserine phosphatase)